MDDQLIRVFGRVFDPRRKLKATCPCPTYKLSSHSSETQQRLGDENVASQRISISCWEDVPFSLKNYSRKTFQPPSRFCPTPCIKSMTEHVK